MKKRSSPIFNLPNLSISAIGICILLLTQPFAALSHKITVHSKGIILEDDTLFHKDATLKIMERVADWQLNAWNSKGFKFRKSDWTNATCYTGLFALGQISKNDTYLKTLIKIGDELNWNTGPDRFMADDYCIAQTYVQLYQKYKDDKMIRPFKLLADSIVAAPSNESLAWAPKIKSREWAWCDALFMAPTSLAYLSKATGDQRYIDKASKLWWKTTEFLYDKSEHLYSRDSRFLLKTEKNGKKVFWSRGNGWVLGGITRMVDNMPKNHPDRKKFINLYKDMVAKIASIQQADGSWHTSLLDPDSYPTKETSGTGFYCYAILWGLNNGVIKKADYWPVAQKAWAALTSSVEPNGMLGSVQQIAGAPTNIAASSTEVYAVGSFLLAGSEMYKYLDKNK
jgi:unsaturated rhamnogalacturonyl hydrolase